MIPNNSINKNNILNLLIVNQRKNIPYNLRLDIDDIIRIINHIDTNPFDTDNCCIWQGVVTYNLDKLPIVNFYLKHKKKALHRLLYINYVNDLPNNTYIRHICKNKGICCNINHIELCNKLKSPNKKSLNNST